VVRVWEQPVEKILAAGLTVLPLAPVAQVEEAQVPDVLVAMSERFEREANREQVGTLWTATKNPMGLRYSEEQVDEFIGGVYDMLFGIRGIEESSVYQGILRKGEARGRVEEARKFLAIQGRKKFGPPDEQTEAKIAALSDLERLHELGARILDVASWDELLGSLNP
jgi:hypothetical protein